MNLRDIAKRYVLNDTELNIVETIMNELAIGNERISI
ncbi:MurR/RpiR family transcriptional regulator, partial [Coprobacillus cateniformis]|nr:MurR/RpiR family transcriptional regulator [Coprobacillus cateniformis]